MQLIKKLYNLNRALLGEGIDKAYEIIGKEIDLKMYEFKTGEKYGTWTVPQEWIVRDAWVKYNGKKIIDYKKQPLSLMVGSEPFHGTMDKDELKKHLFVSDELPEATPYEFTYYKKKWGFSVPADFKYDKKGKYEVFIDTEHKDGVMKVAEHTIPGKSDREIILIAHLDHPFQANDNLSGVQCLVDLAKKLKCEHTIKIVFCPETIGSIAYALSRDLSKVDFVISADIVGNDNTILLQKSWDLEHRINKIAHLAVSFSGEDYRKGTFRALLGGDEYVFNDPNIGIQGLLLSRFPYDEYHTSADTPSIVKQEKIDNAGNIIQKIIDIYEKDFIPVKNFKGPLFRSQYDIQTFDKKLNLAFDYLIYAIDGKKYLSEIVADCGLDFTYCYDLFEKMKNDNLIGTAPGKGEEQTT